MANSQTKKNFPETNTKDNNESVETIKACSAIAPIMRIAVPAIMTFFVTRMADTLAYRFLGQLANTSYTAAAGTARVWLLMVMGSIVFGFVSAIDTLVSQSFGKRDYEMCGIHFNRGSLFSFLIALLLSPLAFYSSTFLRLMGMNEINAYYTQKYASVLVIHIILSPQVVAAQKFLRSQKITYPQLIITIVLYALHPFWAYFFIHWLKTGFVGAAYARCCTTILSLLGLHLYIRYSKSCAKTFVLHSLKSFQGLDSYFALSYPSAVMNCLSSWGYQIVYFMSISLPTEQVAANAVLIDINILSSAIHSGISSSMAVLVGNSLGAKRAKDAKVYIRTALIMLAILCITCNLFLIIFKEQIARHYSKDEKLVRIISNQIYLMTIELIFDNLQGIFGGVLLGMGRQKVAIMANLVSYYFVMIPCVYFFAHVLKYEVRGIWIGMTLGYAAVAIYYISIVLCEDWDNLEKETIEKLEKNRLKLKSS